MTKGQIHCALLMAKSRVTPLKALTIPRLELAAVVLSVRIHTIPRKQLDCENVKKKYF